MDEILIQAITSYWNEHIHDLEIATQPVGTAAFFQELAAYRYDKLHYLPQLLDFNAFQGQSLLEVGCGVGLDLARFAQGGADVTGVDLSGTAVALARQNFTQQNLTARLEVMNGEALPFADDSFDAVYAHGVLPYTADPQQMIRECHRVLRPGGQGIFMVYNRHSWLNALSKVVRTELEHEDAPALRKFSKRAFTAILYPFSKVTIIPERFPVPTQLHQGVKAALYNELFVRLFNALPRAWTRSWGWHLLAFAEK